MRCAVGLLFLHALTFGCTAAPATETQTAVEQSTLDCGASTDFTEISWKGASVSVLAQEQVAQAEQLQGGTIYQPIYKVTFNGTAPLDIANGTLVALDGTNGFFGRVHNLQNATQNLDGSLVPATAVVVSDGVTLDEVVDAIDADVTACAKRPDGTSFVEQGFKFGTVAIVAREGANVEEFEYSFEDTVLEFDPQLKVEIKMGRDSDADPIRIKHFRIRAAGQLVLPYHIAAAMQAQGTVILRGVVPTGIRFPAFAGPIPLWIELKAGIDIEFNGRGDFSIDSKGRAEAAFEFDSVIDPGAITQPETRTLMDVQTYREPAFSHQGTSDTVANFHGAARLGVSVGVGVYIAGLVGPSISVKPYFKLNGCAPELDDSPIEDETCTPGWDLSFGTSVLVGLEVNELLPVNIAARKSFTLFEESILSGGAPGTL